jgi:hypothetical protein
VFEKNELGDFDNFDDFKSPLQSFLSSDNFFVFHRCIISEVTVHFEREQEDDEEHLA